MAELALGDDLNSLLRVHLLGLGDKYGPVGALPYLLFEEIFPVYIFHAHPHEALALHAMSCQYLRFYRLRLRLCLTGLLLGLLHLHFGQLVQHKVLQLVLDVQFDRESAFPVWS